MGRWPLADIKYFSKLGNVIYYKNLQLTHPGLFIFKFEFNRFLTFVQLFKHADLSYFF